MIKIIKGEIIVKSKLDKIAHLSTKLPLPLILIHF